MTERELRRYVGQMLLQLADLANEPNVDELDRLAFKMRLLADEADKVPVRTSELGGPVH
jgi:hypothetical protein